MRSRAEHRSRMARERHEREQEVLRLLAQGQSNREIADALFISHRTVARHLTNIFHKIDVLQYHEVTAIEREAGGFVCRTLNRLGVAGALRFQVNGVRSALPLAAEMWI